MIMIPDKKEKKQEKTQKSKKKSLIEFGLDPTITQDCAILLFWGPKKIIMIMIIPDKKEKKQERTQKSKKIIN